MSINQGANRGTAAHVGRGRTELADARRTECVTAVHPDQIELLLDKYGRNITADARDPSLKPPMRALCALFLVVAAVIVRALWSWASG